MAALFRLEKTCFVQKSRFLKKSEVHEKTNHNLFEIFSTQINCTALSVHGSVMQIRPTQVHIANRFYIVFSLSVWRDTLSGKIYSGEIDLIRSRHDPTFL